MVEYPGRYTWTLEPAGRVCGPQRRPFVVLLVPVAPGNRAHRDTIRSTWGSVRTVLGKNVTTLFMLGRPSGDTAQDTQRRVSTGDTAQDTKRRDIYRKNLHLLGEISKML